LLNIPYLAISFVFKLTWYFVCMPFMLQSFECDRTAANVPNKAEQQQDLHYGQRLGAKAVRFQEGCSRSQWHEAALSSRSGGVQQRVS